MRRTGIAILSLVAMTAACGDKVCILIPAPTIQVDIRDSVTGAPAAYGASLIIEAPGVYDSSFVGPRPDSLTIGFVQSAPIRATNDFVVRVRRAGYKLWQQTGVHVDVSAECGTGATRAYTARLQRLP